MNLTITIEEGPQYHMGKLDIVADKEVAGRLRMQWKLTERDPTQDKSSSELKNVPCEDKDGASR